jgi:monoterpene epsilon-lactone hydrolase
MRINHPLQAADREAMAAMRPLLLTAKGSITGPSARGPFDELMVKTPSAVGVTYEKAEVGGIPGWWCRPGNSPARAAILYLHGGAYIAGSARAYRSFVGQVAERANVAAFVTDYGLAPEHPFPAALRDAESCYKGLVELGFRKIALAGDSAGGGLALVLLSLLVSARQSPVGATVMSPWTDLALSGASMQTRADADPLMTKDSLASTAELYLGAHNPYDPTASPLYGDLIGLPPIRIHVGEDEILLDDSLRYGARVELEGGAVQVHVWEGMIHVFPANLALRAAKEALEEIGEFLRSAIV